MTKKNSVGKASKTHKTSSLSKLPKNSIGIIPLQDRVLIKEESQEQEKKTSSGIILPSGTSEDKGSKRGQVVAIGLGKNEDGKIVPLTVKVGDRVLFQWGDKIKVGETEYYIVRESEILAVIG